MPYSDTKLRSGVWVEVFMTETRWDTADAGISDDGVWRENGKAISERVGFRGCIEEVTPHGVLFHSITSAIGVIAPHQLDVYSCDDYFVPWLRVDFLKVE